MATRFLVVAAASLLATITAAQADVINSAFIQGSYTAVNTGSSPYNPTINNDGGAYLPSPFSGTLTVGQLVSTTFLQVAPVAGGANVGTIAGSIAIDMALAGPGGSAVTSVTSSAGGNGATLSNGNIDFLANYELFYGNQTDCISWNSATCTSTGVKNQVSETLAVTFADNAVLDIELFNWSDWNMSPEIGFDLVSGPSTTTVPEPASLAVFAMGLLGLGMLARRGRTSPATMA